MVRISVEVIEYETDRIVKKIECGQSLKRAHKIDDGVNINLNHSKFYTRIKEEKGDVT